MKELSYGTFLGLASPLSAEIAGLAGMDWVLLDLEHGASTEGDIGAVVVASRARGIDAYVRVESSERIRIGRALDAGAAGVMVPRIESVDDVRQVLTYMSYPPHGIRGVATYNRSAAWGKDLSAIESGRSAQCIIQIESLGALADVDQIASLDGVDVLFVGPLDLSFALGIPRDFKNPVFVEATLKVIAAAKAHGKVAGILAADAASAIELRDRGFGFIAIGSDSTLLSQTLTSTIEKLKN